MYYDAPTFSFATLLGKDPCINGSRDKNLNPYAVDANFNSKISIFAPLVSLLF